MGVCNVPIRPNSNYNKSNERFNTDNYQVKKPIIKVQESMNQSSSKENQKQIVPNYYNSICTIKIQKNSETITGIGFLLKFYIDKEMFYCLISSENRICKNIKNIDLISVNYGQSKTSNIKLNTTGRYKSIFNEYLEVTIVEITDEDGISEDYFLFPEEDIRNNKLINYQIKLPILLDGNKIIINQVSIEIINNLKFKFSCYMEKNSSSGSPIFLKDSEDVLGIHKIENLNRIDNYGYFIYPIIEKIEGEMRKRRNHGKYENGKYTWDDGKYYEGELKNNMPHGKGKKYYRNGKILYEGDFINGKFDGKGKYIYDDGEYYEGDFKKGLRNGEGTEYYSNEKINYEGYFIKDKYEGEGKYIWEDGTYYIGHWKNGLRNGKGKQYNSSGNVIYEGIYCDDKIDGFGKYFWENGEYYEGRFKEGQLHGYGKNYYSNGNIKYEGHFKHGERDGEGKYFYKDGRYYIGNWKNDLRNGEGTMYYSNQMIQYEGNWVNDKYEGTGKYIFEEGDYYIGLFKNDSFHGKGILYDINGKIIEDDWISGNFEGTGTKHYNDGTYYKGQLKNGLRNGTGYLYDSEGKIKCRGNWINDEFVGN